MMLKFIDWKLNDVLLPFQVREYRKEETFGLIILFLTFPTILFWVLGLTEFNWARPIYKVLLAYKLKIVIFDWTSISYSVRAMVQWFDCIYKGLNRQIFIRLKHFPHRAYKRSPSTNKKTKTHNNKLLLLWSKVKRVLLWYVDSGYLHPLIPTIRKLIKRKSLKKLSVMDFTALLSYYLIPIVWQTTLPEMRDKLICAMY